jgi:hypothetical protein
VKKQNDSRVQHNKKIDELKMKYGKIIYEIQRKNHKEIMAILNDKKS